MISKFFWGPIILLSFIPYPAMLLVREKSASSIVVGQRATLVV